jgi:NADH-quinone oxidoreductase subunit N
MNGDMNMAFLAILPEIGLVVLAVTILVLDLTLMKRHHLGWVVVAGLTVIAVLAVLFARPAVQGQLFWGGMIRLDGTGFLFRMIFLVGAALTTLFSFNNEELSNHGEFYMLLVVSTLGMCLMASAADLILLYLAIEMTSIPLFVLAGFYTQDERSVESGLKYMLYAAMTSAVMLYGFSLLYGFTGTTNLYQIAESLLAGHVSLAAVGAALVLVVTGFSFKVSAAPFHFWAPDVYEGAPTPVTGFLSTASKAAGFAVLIRVLIVAFPTIASVWSLMVGILAAISMIVGNFVALTQRNIKRLLAYSSIAQAGYMLIGVASFSKFGTSATIYYLMAYLVTNLAAFGIITVIGQSVGSDDISAYAGLSRRSPALAFLLLAAVLSLGGVPPFAGFIGKLLVFGSAIKANMVWLAFLGVINSIVALYYYLNILKVVYLHPADENCPPIKVIAPWAVALGICAAGILVLGVVVAPWLGLSGAAAILY